MAGRLNEAGASAARAGFSACPQGFVRSLTHGITYTIDRNVFTLEQKLAAFQIIGNCGQRLIELVSEG